MEQKKKVIEVIVTIGILLICLAGYLYYGNVSKNNKTGKTSAKATTEQKKEKNTENVDTANKTTEQTTEDSQSKRDDTSQKNPSTTESKKKQKLPKDYVWDYERWGEPPQIVYDFAENQEKFDTIVNEVDSIISEEDGFSTGIDSGEIYYDSGYENIEDKLDSKLKKNAKYILNNTKFYKCIKEVHGHWIMYYNQEEYRERYIYTMVYDPELPEEEIREIGYIQVVGDWYFYRIWRI